MTKDFNFILSIMNGFVKQKAIQNKLNIIDRELITGWEIWFQIEFASYLTNHDLVGDWFREHQFPIDGRKDKIKYKMAIDFIVRQKNYKKDSYIALELKQHNCIETCISNMLKDIVKVQKIPRSSNVLRSFWNIGIHKRDIKSNIYYKIQKKLKQKNFKLDNKFIEVRYIPGTDFAFTIF